MAASPSSSGISTSMVMMSGLRSRASSTASRPLRASPTTVSSLPASMMRRRTMRMKVESSTTRTRRRGGAGVVGALMPPLPRHQGVGRQDFERPAARLAEAGDARIVIARRQDVVPGDGDDALDGVDRENAALAVPLQDNEGGGRAAFAERQPAPAFGDGDDPPAEFDRPVDARRRAGRQADRRTRRQDALDRRQGKRAGTIAQRHAEKPLPVGRATGAAAIVPDVSAASASQSRRDQRREIEADGMRSRGRCVGARADTRCRPPIASTARRNRLLPIATTTWRRVLRRQARRRAAGRARRPAPAGGAGSPRPSGTAVRAAAG